MNQPDPTTELRALITDVLTPFFANFSDEPAARVNAGEAAAALAAVLPGRAACPDPVECSHEAALGEAQQERDRLRERVADYENRITWHTTCGSCARILDSSIQATEQTEAYRLALSEALGLGNGAPWDAIQERAAELAAAVPSAPTSRAVVPAEGGDEGDELVCVDGCGSCDACGMEPFGTPAEGWREAARFLRRTARDSGYRISAVRGAQLIEAELRRRAEEAAAPAAEEQPSGEPTEPDNPAAYALARHIADYPMSTVQAAFRYLNSPMVIELVAAEEQPESETPRCNCPSEDVLEHQFGTDDCTCIPFTRQDGTPRYCQRGDTVDMISGWERGRDCLHHAPPAVVPQPEERP